MIDQHLPILQVVVPLLSAPLALLLGRRLAGPFTLAVSWTTFALAVLLLLEVLDRGILSYAVGGWPAPWGIEYRVDTVGAFVVLIVAGINALMLPFLLASAAAEIAADRRALFYTAYLLCLSGLLGITVTGDAFNLFVFLEISSLSSYALISLGRDRRALTAAYQYLIMGTIGATFLLIGVGLLYAMTGTLNMLDLAQRLPALMHTRTVRSAFAFLTVGIGLKLAMFPLHLWLPNAYAYAPSAISAFLAATATKVAVYALLRFVFTVFGVAFAFETMPFGEVLFVLAVLGVLVGSAVAIFQDNVKRMLAYSSVAQIGYILLGISFASLTGVTSAALHLFNHALIKGALFLALGCVAFRTGAANLHQLRGLGRHMPWTMAAFVLGGLSLIGVPLTTGFISKWYLVLAALERGAWSVAVVVLGASLLAVAYVWRVVEAAYFQAAAEDAAPVREAPLALLLPTWALIIGNFYFGIHTELSLGLARRAAATLLGVGS